MYNISINFTVSNYFLPLARIKAQREVKKNWRDLMDWQLGEVELGCGKQNKMKACRFGVVERRRFLPGENLSSKVSRSCGGLSAVV